MKRNRAVFLDRDGTINRDAGFTHRVCDLELLDNVVPALQSLAALGFRLIIATNQSGIARGYFNEADMRAFNRALLERLSTQGVRIDDLYYCPFHEIDGQGFYRRESSWRKPRPGMLLEAAREHQLDLTACYLIGDKRSDIVAGRAAGCHTILVRTGAAGSGEPELECQPEWVADDLLAAAGIIQTEEQAAAARRPG